MEIWFVNRWLGYVYGGTEKHIKELASRLSKLGHKIVLITESGHQDALKEFKAENPSIEVRYISARKIVDKIYNSSKRWFFRVLIHLITRKLLNSLPDVVSVHFYTEGVALRIINWFFKLPYVFVLEGYTYGEAEEAKRAYDAIAISDFIGKKCKESHSFAPKRIPLGVDISMFNPTVNGMNVKKKYCKNKEYLILTVGRLVERKDFPSIVKAAKIVSKNIKNIKFLFVGEGDEKKKIRELIKKLRLTNKVLLVGAVEDKDLPKYYRAADLFVYYPLEELFGIVYLEAMACKVPIVASNTGSSSEVVDGAGILIPPKNPKKLAKTIIHLLKNGELRKKLSDRGLFLVKQRYRWENLIKKYERIYKNVVNKK